MIAVDANMDELIASFTQAWPLLEPKISVEVRGWRALGDWMQAHRVEVRIDRWSLDNPDIGAYAFWQDGAWAVLSDPRQVPTVDEDALAAPSRRFGLTRVFHVESMAESASFVAFDAGRAIRKISASRGSATTSSRKLWREFGIPVRGHFMQETDRLQRRFGIVPWDELPDDMPFKGAAYIDRKDYSERQASLMARLAKPTAAS